MIRPILMLALSASLVAEDPAPAPPPVAPPGKAALDAHFMDKFRQMKIVRLQQIGISESQARAMADRWDAWDRAFMDRGRQMMQVEAKCNEILLGPASEDEKNVLLKPLVEQFLSLRQQQDEAKRKFELTMLKPLTFAQQARMIRLMKKVQEEIRETLREARRGGGRL